ncbi:6-phosphogluconolactonase [Martelella sp. HB161492]|uniref:6-phosphogluconolactonase n=1 Tax=Martelella sp. HB161492 TaxID=2720726 RepID=UPI00158FA525|nr:6-phosphogluconolactonase [Martelella sp. HB161492]
MEHLKYGELEVLVGASDQEQGEAAAEALATTIKAELAKKDEICIIMALGAAQPQFFTAIKARNDIEWSKITVLHVDTYMGVHESQEESGASRMRKHLLNEVKPKAFYPMNGAAESLEDELARYTKIYNDHQPVLCVVGIGESGHLAFNDPPADFDTKDVIRVVALDPTTRGQVFKNGIFKTMDAVPKYGLSLTMHALLKPGRVLALVHEKDKAPVIKTALEGPVTFMCPASLLKKTPQATLYLNQDAASLLDR